MIWRFDNFCEQWAQVYTPLRHVPSKDSRNKRFFRHDSLDERLEVVKQLVTANKTDVFMSVITAFDGDLARAAENSPKPNFYVWRRHALFWVKTALAANGSPLDELSAADAKARGVEMAADFISFLDYCADPRKGNMPELRGIDFDSLEISTLPVSFNGWWITVVNFDQSEPREKCVADARYDTSALAGMFSNLNLSHL